MKNCAFCLKIDMDSREWDISARSVELYVSYAGNPFHNRKWNQVSYAVYALF